MSFEIEKDIPIPRPTRRHGYSKYPLPEMEVGDSFFEAADDGNAEQVRNRLAKAADHRRRAFGLKFTVRKVDGGFRVWRIE